MKSFFLLITLLIPINAIAQPCVKCGDNLIPPYTGEARKIADITSYVAVGVEIGIDSWKSWKSDNRKLAFEKQALRTISVIGITEVTKLIIHRTRPDGSDNKSFPSEHTALAFASLHSMSLTISIPLSSLTALGRMKADRHYLTDVAIGAVIGSLVDKYR